MKVLLVAALFVTATFALTNEEVKQLEQYVEELPEEEQSEIIQNLADALIGSLTESGDMETLTTLYDALREVTNKERERRDASSSALTDRAKDGHCCLGGDLVVTYAEQQTYALSVHSVNADTNNQHQSCGLWGWRRCHTTISTTHKVAYHATPVKVTIPHFACGAENSVCCHGYVSITKFPGDYAAFGAESCVPSKEAFFTIINLQLFEKVTEGVVSLSAEQLSKILGTVEKFFVDSGIKEE